MLRERSGRVGPRFAVPALLTAIAYVDPGNFGVNLAAGASYGHALVWVVVAASVTATLIQYLAAKLGAVSGVGLARDTADRVPPVLRLLAWAQAELVVLMTDLAELVGGAIALNLLVGLPLPVGAVLVAAASLAVLGLRRTGIGPLTVVVLTLLAVIVVAIAAQLVLLRLGAPVVPAPAPIDRGAVLLAVGIVGATVMPHALHFHSALSVSRPAVDPHPERPVDAGSEASATGPSTTGPTTAGPSTTGAVSRRAGVPMRSHPVRPVRVALIVAAAMVLASATNVALVYIGADLPREAGADLATAATAIGVSGGEAARVLFGIALLASGLAATVVGGYTGQIVMDAFWRRPLPVWIRRLVGVVIPLGILIAGVDPTRALVISQVVLSFCLPGTLVPLVVLTARRSVMGRYVNRRTTTILAAGAAVAITAMDVVLLVLAAGGGV